MAVAKHHFLVLINSHYLFSGLRRFTQEQADMFIFDSYNGMMPSRIANSMQMMENAQT